MLLTQSTKSFGGLGFFVALTLCLLNLLSLRKVWLKSLQVSTTLGTAALLFPTLGGAPLPPATWAVNWTFVGGVAIGSAAVLGLVLTVFRTSPSTAMCGATNTDLQQPGTTVAAVEPTRNEE
ncbi:hypothetical protein [Paludibacterium denitrificans]|uniref:Uncharacterized protein n=1 Tax=Paludibacterium denitrificans TaxID=2675226 RepID=A0A844GEF3_9NEIS|nr:hypothetical protein [Paludibacterium denitrificans]MTD33598.1 hypothetical protein [Paludibacterium denitrificans]